MIGNNPSIITDGMVFHYDMGNSNSYKGPPIKNVLTEISPRGISDNGSTYRFFSGTEDVYIPSVGYIRDCNYVDMYNDYNGGSNNCCPSPFGYGQGLSVTGNTVYTYGILYRSANRYTNPNLMYHYEYGPSGYITEYGVHDAGYSWQETHLGNDWYWSRAKFTTNSSTNTLYTGSWMYQYATWNRWNVAKVILVAGDYTNLHPKYWPDVNTTRSTSAVLTDLAGNNSITTSSLTYNSDGTFTFNGSNYIDISNSSLISGTNPFTIESWTNKTSGSYGAILGNYGSGYASGLWWATAGLYLGGAVYHSDYSNSMAGVHYSACTRDGSGNIVLYRDGVQVNTGVLGSSIPANINWRIGADVNGGGEALNGDIYSVRVYNRALSASEIGQNFNAHRRRYGI